LPDSEGVYEVAFSADGKTVLGASPDKLRVWEAATGKTAQASDLKHGSMKCRGRFAFSPDGKTLALAGSDAGKHVVALWDVRTAKRTQTLEGHEGVIDSLAFSPDGKTLASGGEGGTIRLWDFDPGAKLK
jgi:WD40 repeat protein